VYEVLSDLCNITIAQARKICHDFTEAGVIIGADDPASDHEETVEGICFNMAEPDIRAAILAGEEDIYYEADSSDPFFYCPKIDASKISLYLKNYSSTEGYTCAICQDTYSSKATGVTLACFKRNPPCSGVFCRECITQWVTKCISRCPLCRTFLQEHKDIGKASSKKKISVRRRDGAPQGQIFIL